MPFTSNGESYASVLDVLRDNRTSWESARTVAECREAVAGIGGVDAAVFSELVADLSSHYGGGEEQMLEQLRLSALAWPAADYGLTGPEWTNYFVTGTEAARQLYAADRCATAQEWTELEVSAESLALTYDEQTGLMYDQENWYLPDGKTHVTLDATDPATSRDADGNVYVRGVLHDGADTVTDLRETHFDTGEQRWRRWSDAGDQFEYYHDADGVWERRDDTGLWHRYHSEQHGWLPYAASGQPAAAAGKPEVAAATFATAEEAQEGAAQVASLVQEALNQALTALPSEVVDALSPQELESLAVEAVKAVAGQN